jgi:hypothetical protein
VQRQLVANGEVLARYGDAPDSENPPQNGAVPKYVNTAEFHLNAPALKLRDTSFSAMSYTVVGGETLKTIARNGLGDSSLWWRIAGANGLAVSGDGELTAGQTLSIPKLALNANSTGNFQLNDPSGITLGVAPSPHKPRHPRPKRPTPIHRRHQILIIQPLLHDDAPQAFLDC